jgi:hypothetical protein
MHANISGVRYTHLNKKEEHIPLKFKAGDVRNEGIRFIRTLDPPPHPDSVVYFAGTYAHVKIEYISASSCRLFDHFNHIQCRP